MRSPTPDCVRFNLVLQAEFPPNAMILASEALRIANQNTGQRMFDWRLVSEDGRPVRASNGMEFECDCSVDRMPDAEVCLLFEGNLPTQLNSNRLLRAIRGADRRGATVGGIDTGAFALAEAGVAPVGDGSATVLHWEAAPTFLERFPTAEVRNQIFLFQGRRAHCAGGVATLDMVLALIAEFKGEALANEIADALVHTRRPAETPQRGSGQTGSASDAAVRRLVRLMEQNLETPLVLSELARKTGVSRRTLARLSHRAFGLSPMRLYLALRLQAARNFLFYDEFSITEVAMACGFSQAAVFSRAFRSRFGQSPRAFRAEVRASQNLALRPELHRLAPDRNTTPTVESGRRLPGAPRPALEVRRRENDTGPPEGVARAD